MIGIRLCTLLACLHWVVAAVNPDVLAEIFNLDPGPVQALPLTPKDTLPSNYEPTPCRTQDSRDGLCKSYWQCISDRRLRHPIFPPKDGQCPGVYSEELWCCSSQLMPSTPVSTCGLTRPSLNRRYPSPQYPWTVAIFSNDTTQSGQDYLGFYCTGTLIHASVVLTGAYCIRNRVYNETSVATGAWYHHPDASRSIPLSEMVSHPSFDSSHYTNDIALLFLSRPAQLSDHVGIACLPEFRSQPPDDASCYIADFYYNRKSKYYLVKMDARIIDRDACETSYEKASSSLFTLHKSFLCVVGDGDENCISDVGSPFFCTVPGVADRYIQYGIASSVLNCEKTGMPDFHTDVSAFRVWIDQEVQQRGFKTSTYSAIQY